MTMMGSIPIPNTRFYLTSIDGKKWFVTEYYRTAQFNPDKETYDLYKAFAEAFQENERKEREFSEKLKEAVKKACIEAIEHVRAVNNNTTDKQYKIEERHRKAAERI